MKDEILATGRFKKDLKAIMKRVYNIKLLQDVVGRLATLIPKTVCRLSGICL